MKLTQCPADAVQRWKLSTVTFMTKTLSATLWKAHSSYYRTTTAIKQVDDTERFINEVAALAAYNGNGCVQLLNFHVPTNIFIMNFIEPGAPLTSLFPNDDSLAAQHAYTIMQQLHRAPISTTITRTVADWFKVLTTHNSDALPHGLIITARLVAEQLLNMNTHYVMLHGDLHHANIVKNNNTWIALDPKGILGPAFYECGAFMCNPLSTLYLQHNRAAIIKNRLSLFAHLFNVSLQDIARASYVHTIVAACWCIEDSADTEPFIAIAHILSKYI